jgi:hypothetical protein
MGELDEKLTAREKTIVVHATTIKENVASFKTINLEHLQTIAERDSTIIGRDKTIAKLKEDADKNDD